LISIYGNHGCDRHEKQQVACCFSCRSI